MVSGSRSNGRDRHAHGHRELDSCVTCETCREFDFLANELHGSIEDTITKIDRLRKDRRSVQVSTIRLGKRERAMQIV